MPNIKTAISIPAPLFQKAESLAREMSISRSQLFSLAVEDFLRQHENKRLLTQINAACEGPAGDESYRAHARKYHRRSVEGEW